MPEDQDPQGQVSAKDESKSQEPSARDKFARLFHDVVGVSKEKADLLVPALFDALEEEHRARRSDSA